MTDPKEPLPKCVFFKHGAYWLVKKGKWTRLTGKREDLERAYNEAKALNFVFHTPDEEITRYLRLLVARSRSNANNRRGIEHSLTVEDVMELYNQTKGRCAVTRTPFSLIKVGPKAQRPYAPSIDRIDNAKGYTKENCRIVCVAANIGMNTWGADVLRTLLKHIGKQSLDRATDTRQAAA